MKQKLFFSLINFLIFYPGLFAQSPTSQKDINSYGLDKHIETIGGLFGWGTSISNTGYQTYFAVGDYSRSFKIPKKKNFLAWYAEPQFNLVKADSTRKGSIDYEFGLNLGIRNYVKINSGFYFYQMLGSGPHYISAKVKRQASGFIFSDNLALGALLRLNSKSLFLSIQYVQRHISNAGLKDPNGGVNSCNFMIGLSKLK